jgi:hypothetical protein
VGRAGFSYRPTALNVLFSSRRGLVRLAKHPGRSCTQDSFLRTAYSARHALGYLLRFASLRIVAVGGKAVTMVGSKSGYNNLSQAVRCFLLTSEQAPMLPVYKAVAHDDGTIEFLGDLPTGIGSAF